MTEPYEVLVPLGAPKEAWLEARTGLITASDAAALTGSHPYLTWDELITKKVAGDDFVPTAATWMGSQREASNLDIFGRCAGVQVSHEWDGVLLRSREHPWAGATLDSRVVGPSSFPRDPVPEELRIELPEHAMKPGVVIEAKNVRSKSRSLWKKPLVPRGSRLLHYWAQVQFQLLVTGEEVGILFAIVDACEIYHHVIERSEAYHKLLVEAGPRFMAELEEARF